ncbi:MAG: radical SAM protein [Bacteroidota bacterium]
MLSMYHTLYFEATRNCNFSCAYCSSGSGKGKKFKDIPADIIYERVLIPAWELGTRYIEFSGGEFLLRKDAFDILEKAHIMGFRIAIASNGSTLNKKSISCLKDLLGENLLISLGINSFLNNNHETRDRETAFILEKISLLESYHVNINISVTIGKFNAADFAETIEKVRELRLPFNRIPFTPRNMPCHEQMFNKQLLKDFFHPVLRKHHAGYVSYTPFYLDPGLYSEVSGQSESENRVPTNPSVGCWVGSFYSITPDGEVTPCPLLGDHISGGNVLKDNLQDILLKSELFTRITNRKALEGKCGACRFRFVCGGCRVMAFYLAGNVFAEDPTCFIDELSPEELEQMTEETAENFRKYVRMAKYGKLFTKKD